MLGEFCVVCGRTDRPIVEGVCADCFANRTPLVTVPERSTIALCPTCGARKLGQHWEGRGRPTILGAPDLLPLLLPHPEVAIRKVDWVDESANPLLREVDGLVHLRFRDSERTEKVHFTVRIDHSTCPECSRRAGHFYAATIQLRASEDSPRERSQERRERLLRQWDSVFGEARTDWQNAVTWSEDLPEGVDFYFTDVLAARSVARLMKRALTATLLESATLWGRKNGQDVYRVTLCVRVPFSEVAPRIELSKGGHRQEGRPRPRVER